MIWEQIRANQIRSIVLVVAMAAILLALGYFLGLLFFDSAIAGLVIALLIWLILNLVAYFQGDSILLAVSGARKISHDDHPRLFNVVEEMKIASGLEKMPDVYIIDDAALNAFATGRDPKHASVAITSGLLAKLNRDELQGVIAHEISHVKNRDVLLMTMASILLGSIVMLAWYASRMLFWGTLMGGGSRRRGGSGGGGGAGGAIILIVALVLMIVAPILAQLIYFALSRRREYLADASAAQYTRYPEGLASALEKLAASTTQVKAANQATAPMYIINPFREKGRAATDLTSTHPPITERIRILRTMAGNASFAEYDKAYAAVKGSGIMPKSALAAATPAMPLRQEPSEGEPVETPAGKTQRTREVSDLMWKMNRYRTIDCECGTKLKVPPNYKRPTIQCPRCGRVHNT